MCKNALISLFVWNKRRKLDEYRPEISLITWLLIVLGVIVAGGLRRSALDFLSSEGGVSSILSFQNAEGVPSGVLRLYAAVFFATPCSQPAPRNAQIVWTGVAVVDAANAQTQ